MRIFNSIWENRRRSHFFVTSLQLPSLQHFSWVAVVAVCPPLQGWSSPWNPLWELVRGAWRHQNPLLHSLNLFSNRKPHHKPERSRVQLQNCTAGHAKESGIWRGGPHSLPGKGSGLCTAPEFNTLLCNSRPQKSHQGVFSRSEEESRRWDCSCSPQFYQGWNDS